VKFLGDMPLGAGVATWLRSRGHDSIHLSEIGLQRATDEAIFEKAALESRIIVTTDLDFPELVAMSGGNIVSVIVFRMANPTTRRVISRMENVLSVSDAALNDGAIVVIEDSRHRIRRLPLGSDR